MKILSASVFTLLLILILPLISQSQIAIGQWRDHLPYSKTISVADAGNLVYCATPYSLFFLDKAENSVQRLTKVNGLSDIGISTIAYNEAYETLLIAYTNANIDLVKGNTIVNISDIKRKPILGNKTINNIMFIDNFAYLACGFGIVVLDIEKEEFPEPTYFIGPDGSQVNVMDVAFGMDSLFAATEVGIYKADINSPNLADYSSWSVDTRLHPNLFFNQAEFFNGDLIVNNENEGYNRDTTFLYNFTTHQWGYFPGANHLKKPSIKTAYDQLLITSEGAVSIFNSSLEMTYNIYSPGERFINPQDATIDGEGMKWIADNGWGLIKTESGYSAEFIEPNGPFSASVFDMSLQGQNLWVAAGGRTSTWGKMYNPDGLYSFENESWQSYNKYLGVAAFDTISDVVCVAVDPFSPNRVFAGVWRQTGLIEFIDGQLTTIYDESNSSLEKWPAANAIAISGVAFDNQNNLWVANSGAASLISVKEPNGTWTSFHLGAGVSGTDIGKMMVDSYGQKWVLMRTDNALLVFSDNNTISDPTDDQTKVLSNSAGNGDLPGNKILSFAQDLDGELWIGSDEGIGIIYSPENVFTGGNYDAQRPLVDVGGYVQYLLESETVTAITVDGANKKWIGTERAGVFYLSEDGTEEIEHFTEENSPLYSNSIIGISISASGEVFFGTDRGIISYKGQATPPTPTNTEVVAYPNPVKEGYEGVIAIKGLVQNADVKITDISGALIYATQAEGGQAIWNGYSFNGSRAHTGVYLVFATNDDGSESIVTKILVIN